MNVIGMGYLGYGYNPSFSSISAAELKKLEQKVNITEVMEKNGKKNLHDIVKCWHEYDPSLPEEWQTLDSKLVNAISHELKTLNIINGGLYTQLGNDVLEAYGLADDECR